MLSCYIRLIQLRLSLSQHSESLSDTDSARTQFGVTNSLTMQLKTGLYLLHQCYFSSLQC